MSSSENRGWAAFTIVGLALWIGFTVLVTVLADDPSSGRPTLLAFAGGGAVFFGILFGVSFWQTRPRRDPELDMLLAELALETNADPAGLGAAGIGAMRRVARAYIVLGALVTTLGLSAVVQEAIGGGSIRTTITAMLVIVVLWALAIPFVMRLANRASAAVLEPLGLRQSGAVLGGERRGRAVRVDITAKGSVTRLEGECSASPMSGDEVLVWAGRGDSATWRDVSLDCTEGKVVVRRDGHEGPSWLWDLWLAERLAGEETVRI